MKPKISCWRTFDVEGFLENCQWSPAFQTRLLGILNYKEVDKSCEQLKIERSDHRCCQSFCGELTEDIHLGR